MITEEQIHKVLEKNYKQYKIHVAPHPFDEDRFLFHINRIGQFGLDKSISPEEMEKQLRDNFLTCLVELRNRIVAEVFDVISYDKTYDIWDIALLAKGKENETG